MKHEQICWDIFSLWSCTSFVSFLVYKDFVSFFCVFGHVLGLAVILTNKIPLYLKADDAPNQ